MWTLRRVSSSSINLRNRGLSLGCSTRICCGKQETPTCSFQNCSAAGYFKTQENPSRGLPSSTTFYSTYPSSSKSCRETRAFSSQAGAKSRGEQEDDLEAGLSELDTPTDVLPEATSVHNIDDESEEEEEEEEDIPDDMQNELESLGSEANVGGEERRAKTRAMCAMTKAILADPALPVSKALDKWVEEGNEVTRLDASSTLFYLRQRRMYLKALQLSEWLESTKHLEFLENNYASRVDLIAKVRGTFKAENYVKQIPESFRSELIYRSLLANYVSASDLKKAEDVFNQMKNLGFPVTCFSCNQLLLLYKKTDKKKIADILLLMEKENIKPSVFTYQLLIDVKAQANDITGMEQIVEAMKAEGVKPSSQLYVSLARYYANAGLKDKAEAILKEMEGDDITENRWVCKFLLPIYASLGKTDEVERIWKTCESNPQLRECTAAIEAWGQLKRIENAEAAFDIMMRKLKKPSSTHFIALLKVYANHKMLAKGKDLVKRMGDSGCNIGPFTWDALVKLYVSAGEVEKADSLLEKAAQKKKGRPLFMSYFSILEQYAKRGDVQNAEKIFLKLRRAGYVSRLRQYQTLLQAYVNAKAPAYGFADRMKADNVLPSRIVSEQLAKVDAFKTSAVSELLD